MIRSFKNKALEKLSNADDSSKIDPAHTERVKNILFRLDAAREPSEMDFPGFYLHKLRGKHKGFWAVRVSENYRIWFRMQDGDAWDVDYGDYH